MKTKKIIYEKIPENHKVTKEQKPLPESQKGLTGQEPPLDYRENLNEGLIGQKPPLAPRQNIIVQTSEVSETTRQTTNKKSVGSPTDIKPIGFFKKLSRCASTVLAFIKRFL